jgi:CRP-like cAMP-binding protein
MSKIESAYFNYSEARPILEASNSPFKDLNHHILDNIAVRMEKEIFEESFSTKRHILIHKGESYSKAFYLILEGEVGVIVDKEKGIGFKLGKGSVLGEMSLLNENALPNATVVTISKRVVAYTLTKKAFNDIVEKFPPVRYVLEGLSESRKKINIDALQSYLKKAIRK